MCLFFAWKLGLISSSIQVPKWISHLSKYSLEEVGKANAQNSQQTQFLRYFKYILPIKLNTKYCIWAFCIKFSVAMESVNPKIWCSSCFQKVIIQLEYLFSNRTYFNYLCTKYKRFPEKNFISFREIVWERFSTFRFRQHFHMLKIWLFIFRDCVKPENEN